MKKLTILSIVAILMLSVLCACTTVDNEKLLFDNITFMEETVFEGTNDDFDVKYTAGKKEERLVADGKVGNIIDFKVLQIVPKHMDLFEKEYSYKLIGSNGELEGKFSKDMFGVSFSTNIESVDALGEIQKVLINFDDKISEVTLSNMLVDFIGKDKLIEITAKEFKSELKALGSSEIFPREIFIKFINDNTDESNPYYWYVSIIGDEEDYWSLLIEPRIGTVINKRI